APADPEADGRHEATGARLLGRWFPASVVGPVALHVKAKRYLVATDPSYAGCLSPASQRSLALQGGALTPAEAAAFHALPASEGAIAVRRWDDRAKVRGLEVPPLGCYRRLVLGQVRRPG